MCISKRQVWIKCTKTNKGGFYNQYITTSYTCRSLDQVRSTPKTIEREKEETSGRTMGGIRPPGMGTHALDFTSTEHNNMTRIVVNGYENIYCTRSTSMLSKSRVQEQDGDPDQDSRLLCLMLGWIGEVDHYLRHKVIFPPDSRSLPESSHPHYRVAKRQ